MHFLDCKGENEIHYNNNKLRLHTVLTVSKSLDIKSVYILEIFIIKSSNFCILFSVNNMFPFNDDFLLEEK